MGGLSSGAPVASEGPADLQHGRYKLGRLLGEGGMAVVFAATDLATGREVALKRLRSGRGERQAAIGALFEREYLALAELKHPRIVEVYDYHIDEHGPYYTMELLEGGDLQRIAPLDWRTACTLAYDICSALALVHSRRMVFRDLSPNNVRRTKDGLAKLIDFGALAPMGPSGQLVGTLPCAAPEAVGFAPLDARTDLYALGATLYFSLVRRHAYPGRSVEELTAVWNRPLIKPSELIEGIPAAVDQLVLDLLQHEPDRRPASAGEVMERLSAVAGLVSDEHLLVKEAYLATPALVGRSGVLEAVHQQVVEAKRGAGGGVCLQSLPGIGRSRMLEACALDATRMGMLVLRASAADSQRGDYGVIQALARSLLTQAPTLARKLAEPHAQDLACIIPELRLAESDRAESPIDVDGLHRNIQPLLRQWMCEVAASCPLALAIDDLERIDPPSAAFVGLMSREARHHATLVMTALSSGATVHSALQGALLIHTRFSTCIRLDPLNAELTQGLLSSLFGDVPNLALLTQHVHRITKGNPGDTMKLAEHLVREDVIVYRAGTWSLPSSLSAAHIPSNMAQALAQQVQRLTPEARALCFGLACEPTFAFSFEECARIAQEPRPSALMKSLHALVAAGFVDQTGTHYRAAQTALEVDLCGAISEERMRDAHVQLGVVCAARGDMFRSAQHLLCVPLEDEGMRVLLDFATTTTKETDANPDVYVKMLRDLPPNWMETFEHALQLCARTRRPARDRRALLQRLSGLAPQLGLRVDMYPYVRTLVDELAFDVGLDCFADLPQIEHPGARIKAALARATERFHARAPDERVLDPVSTLPELAKAMTVALGAVAFSSNYADWVSLPSLAPIAPLSPALTLVQWLVDGLGARVSGRPDAALAIYAKVLERLAQADLAGLPPSHHRHTQLRVQGAMGALEATMGRSACLERVELIREEPRFESTALLIEQLHQLFQGDLREARHTKHRLELLRLESNAHHASDAQHLFLELTAYVLAQDMTGTKRALDAVAPHKKLHRGFLAAYLYGQSEYNRMRGDAGGALGPIEEALQNMRAGEHLLWVYAASAHLRTLVEIGSAERACLLGREYLEAASSLGHTQNHVRAALALALLRVGQLSAACALAEQAVQDMLRSECTGLNLAIVCEVRAQIAAAMGDAEAYERCSTLFAQQWPKGHRRLQGVDAAKTERDESADEEDALAHMKSTWETCHSVLEQVHVGLEVMARHMGALGGVLFTRVQGGLVRAASYGDSAKDAELDVWATDYFSREVTHYVTEETGRSSVPPRPLTKHPSLANAQTLTEFAPVVLGHNDEHGYALTGLVVLVGPGTGRTQQPTAVAAELSRCVSRLSEVDSEYL